MLLGDSGGDGWPQRRYVFGLGRKLASLGIERAVTIFGCCCGSTGTGLLLLRILDPDFSTSVAKELAFFNIAILFTCFHIILVMSPILPNYSMTTIWIVFRSHLRRRLGRDLRHGVHARRVRLRPRGGVSEAAG